VHARPKWPVPVLARRRGAARRQQQRSTRGRGGEEAILEAAGSLIAAVNEGSPRDLDMRERGGLAAATNWRPAC
jgi:hypothetical protein